ncbi:MAG: hypothetical protein GKR94_31690 [Gammaproteobacteria bacterium]|nr:hypothetical protein [Gammaproteobacteria bacterium]
MVESSIVKDPGTDREQALPERARNIAALAQLEVAPLEVARAEVVRLEHGNQAGFEAELAFATLIAPKLTIQGGTREILRGIVVRGPGLR